VIAHYVQSKKAARRAGLYFIFQKKTIAMDGTIWIAIFIIGIILLIVFGVTILSISQTRKQFAHLEMQLDETGRQNDCIFDKKEVGRKRAIGLDSTKKKLGYVSLRDSGIETAIFDLSMVQSTEIFMLGNKTITVQKSGSHKTAEHIRQIVLALNRKHHEIGSMVFYDDTEDSVMDMQDKKKKAQEWKELVDSLIKTTSL
jgi:hypothetical protein